MKQALSYKKISLFISFVLFSFGLLKSQVYPVQVSQYFIPPYSTQLSDYASSTENKFNLQLLLQDINENNRQVRLKLYIEGNGFKIQSNDFVIGAPNIYLNGGVMQQFSNVDLRAYFELQNLSGISPSQYSQPLPDGVYMVYWEVYDFITNQRISLKSGIPIYLLQNDPPLLNIPVRGENIEEKNPVNIIFQWTPRHVNATNVSYLYEIREVWDTQMDPQAAFLASPNYYSEETFATTLLYDMGKPVLLPGKTYAWRVKAMSKTGLTENNIFKNNGYSEIYYFKYSASCGAPLYPMAEAVSTQTERIQWQGLNTHTKYHIQYRKKGSNTSWFEVYTQNTQTQIGNLESGATYEFRIGGTCDPLSNMNQSYTYTGINEFTMPKKNETATYNCGIKPDIKITSKTPLPALNVDESFTAGDFNVIVKEVNGQNGVYSGKGYIEVPYLSFIRVGVEFTNVKINTNNQLYDGKVETAYNADWSNVGNITIVTPKTPTNPETPGTPANPANPTDPQTPANPENPSNPETPANPTNPTDPQTPANPENPSNPETPENPEVSENPKTPANPEPEHKYYIKYANKNYKTGDQIIIPYNRNSSSTFEVVGLPKSDTKINWSFYKLKSAELMYSNLSLKPKSAFTLGGTPKIDSKNFNLEAVANELEDNPSVKVEILLKEKDFKLSSFKVTDGDKSKRTASSGQTLYYLKESLSRNTKFDAVFEPNITENEISNERITWRVGVNNVLGVTLGKKSFNKIIGPTTSKVTLSAGYPTETEKSVNIEWVKNYSKQFDVVSPGVKNALKQLSDYVNNIGSVLKKLDNTGRLEFNISFQGQEYLEEDSNSRFYNVKREGGFEGSVDLEFKGFTYGFDLSVVTAQVYLKPIISVSGSGKMQYVKRNDKESFTENGIVMTFGLKADLKVGGKIGFDIVAITVKAEPYAGISSWGEIKYYNSTKSIAGSFGIGKPYVGIKGEVLLGEYNILPVPDYRYTWENIKFEAPFYYEIK